MASPAAYNDQVDVFRDIEYPQMIGQTYLDHGGTTIYAKSLIEEFSAKMIANLYGNPHSASTPAMLSGHMVDSIRDQTLAFFNANPEHFDLVFTQNATASIKLVGEAFRDLGEDSTATTFWYGYHKDAHTSLVGIRDLTKGSAHCFASDDKVEDWLINPRSIGDVITDDALPCLFAYPGQSNMTGRRLPLSWSKKLRASSVALHQNAYTLFDAAALATTAQLDFSDPDVAPDFTAVSFYKIFGFPDLGGLIVRKESGHILSWRKYFGGGTVDNLTVFGKHTVQKKSGALHDTLEDGTLPFHNIIALGCAIDVHNKLYGSMKRVSQHTAYLAYRLYHGMTSLAHHNGQPLCVIYNDVPKRCTYGDPETQGATVAFNLVRSNGEFVGQKLVESQADMHGIYLRSGGLCNAGGIAGYLKIEPWQNMRNWSQGYRCGESGLETINGKPTGVVRVSLGAMSTMKDVDTFLEFLETVYAETEEAFQVAKFNGTHIHWSGLKKMPPSSGNDSGVAGSWIQTPDAHTTLTQAHLKRMASTPNMRSDKPPVSSTTAKEPRQLYDPRSPLLPAFANQVELHHTSPSALVRRPETARYVIPASIYEAATVGHPLIKSQSQVLLSGTGYDNNSTKKRGLLKFLKGRKQIDDKGS